MEYWGIDDLYLEPCCVQRYYQQRELLNWDHQTKKEDEEEVFPEGRVGKVQKILWDLFEKPHTSLGARVSGVKMKAYFFDTLNGICGIFNLVCEFAAAKKCSFIHEVPYLGSIASLQIVAIISISFIIISTIVLTLNTLPYFSGRDHNDHEKDYPPFALLEAIYMSWFSFEFIVRESKQNTGKQSVYQLDALGVLPEQGEVRQEPDERHRLVGHFALFRLHRLGQLHRQHRPTGRSPENRPILQNYEDSQVRKYLS